MNGNTHHIIDALYAISTWIKAHPYITWGIVSAFMISFWSSMKDRLRARVAVCDGVLCIIITLSLLAVMKLAGLHEEWMPVIGMGVGFIGVERIRQAIINGWEKKLPKSPPPQ